jgi:hypothetical protein
MMVPSVCKELMKSLLLRFRLLGTVLCTLVFLSACVSSPSPRAGSGRAAPLGTFSLAGPTFGQGTLLPTRCSVGERQLFLGFDLQDEKAGIVARLVVDPANAPIVRVFQASIPFDKTVLFHRSECRAFHFSLDSTGWRINRIQQLGVSLELDCQLPSGDSIVGKALDGGCL